MPLPKTWAQNASQDLIDHLRARTMAGLPHIGVLGTKEVHETDAPSDIEEDEYTQPTDSDEGDSQYPDWKFVPNKMSYQLTVNRVEKSPLTATILFYIRVNEGCDGDLECVSDDRPKEYCLTTDELLHAFRKYELKITTTSISEAPTIELKIDERPVQLRPDQIKTNIEPNLQKISLLLEDQSDVFLFFQESNPRLTKQKYRIKFTRTVRTEGNNFVVNGELRNESPRAPVQSYLNEDKEYQKN